MLSVVPVCVSGPTAPIETPGSHAPVWSLTCMSKPPDTGRERIDSTLTLVLALGALGLKASDHPTVELIL